MINLSPEEVGLFEGQKQRFIERFGRPPEPNDPIFFDPDRSMPVPFDPEKFTAQTVEILERAGADDATIYAVRETGMLPPIAGHGYSPADLREWAAAIARYHRLHAETPDEFDGGMDAQLTELIVNPQEKVAEFALDFANLLSKERGFDGVDEPQARISELEGEEGTVLTTIFIIQVWWLIHIRDAYEIEARERVVQAGATYAATLDDGIQRAAADLRGFLVSAAEEADLTVGELLERHHTRNVVMGGWTLVHGAVTALGDNDVQFFERLGFPTPQAPVHHPSPRRTARRRHPSTDR